MAEEYPLSKYSFQVDWGGTTIGFNEVTGLAIEREVIEYRHGDSKNFSTIVMPGLVKNNNIVLKRGIFVKHVEFYEWWEEVSNEKVDSRRDITIRFLNEKYEPVLALTACRCFPVKITFSDLKSDANEVAIEMLEIAHEGLKVMKI